MVNIEKWDFICVCKSCNRRKFNSKYYGIIFNTPDGVDRIDLCEECMQELSEKISCVINELKKE